MATISRAGATSWAPDQESADTPERYPAAATCDQDDLSYYRAARTNDVEYMSISPTGWPTATLRTNVRWTQTFGVRGDDRTMTQTTHGVLWDLRPAQGPALFRVVGTLLEPYDGPATFGGQVAVDGVPKRYDDVPLDDILDEDEFLANLGRAATARP